MAISICIPTSNRLEHLKKLIKSVRDGIEDYPYEFIIADGGSTDGTIEYLKKQKDAKLIEMGKQTGGIEASFFRKEKSALFWSLQNNPFVIKLFDWVLQQSVLFNRETARGDITK